MHEGRVLNILSIFESKFSSIKNKDDLQLAINLLKKEEDDLDIALQFENYR